MSVEISPMTKPELDQASQEQETWTAEERLLNADEVYGENLGALTSCGTQASLVLHHINKLDLKSPVIFLNTGFYPKATYDFKNGELAQFWKDREFHEFGPPPAVVEYVRDERLAYTNKELYDWAVKGRYLTQAIGALGIEALITGVHRDQTANRSTMGPLGHNNNGKVMVRAFVDWTDEQVYGFIEENKLPTHPMYPESKFVGDVHFLHANEKVECGIHIDRETGRMVRGMDPELTALIFDRLVELDPEAPVGM
jgi:phosphoadenosine phosphosulfate reductase